MRSPYRRFSAGVFASASSRVRCLARLWRCCLLAASGRAARRSRGIRGRGRWGWGALRGPGRPGDAGPLLNPSGMSLVKTLQRRGGLRLRAAGSPRTSSTPRSSTPRRRTASRAALYYTYHTDNPGGRRRGPRPRGGLALSFPFGECVAHRGDAEVLPPVGRRSATRRATDERRDVRRRRHGAAGVGSCRWGWSAPTCTTCTPAVAPIGSAYGVALLPDRQPADGGRRRDRFTADNYTGRKGTSLMGGADGPWPKRLALRAGGGYDASTGNGYLTGGLSALSEIGAIDVGVPAGRDPAEVGRARRRRARRCGRQPAAVRPGRRRRSRSVAVTLVRRNLLLARGVRIDVEATLRLGRARLRRAGPLTR